MELGKYYKNSIISYPGGKLANLTLWMRVHEINEVHDTRIRLGVGLLRKDNENKYRFGHERVELLTKELDNWYEITQDDYMKALERAVEVSRI